MGTFKPVIMLKPNKSYHPGQIIAGFSQCYFDTKQPASIKSCGDINKMLAQIYHFDPMTKKLFAVVALSLLETKVPIHFSNDKATLLNDIPILLGAFAGGVIYEQSKQVVKKVILNYNKVDGAIGENAVYAKTTHELTHYAMYTVVNKMSAHHREKVLPYHNTGDKEAYEDAVQHTLAKALATVNVEIPITSSLELARELYCTYSQIILDQESQKKEQALIALKRKASISEYLTAEIMYYEIKAITDAACQYSKGDFLGEMIVRPFEQIPNGLASNTGAHYNELYYLEPVVNFVQTNLYPVFDQYIASQCAESTAYSCQFRGNELHTVTLLEDTAVHLEL